MTEIEHFFTPVSGYAYLGHDALLRLAGELARMFVNALSILRAFSRKVDRLRPPNNPTRVVRIVQPTLRAGRRRAHYPSTRNRGSGRRTARRRRARSSLSIA